MIDIKALYAAAHITASNGAVVFAERNAEGGAIRATKDDNSIVDVR